MKNTNIIHLPDLQFVRFCEEKYGVNRGVYNTIDSWFYRKGLIDIVIRRKTIIQFLEYVSYSYRNSKVKFGHGGLSSCLSNYWDKYRNNIDVISKAQ